MGRAAVGPNHCMGSMWIQLRTDLHHAEVLIRELEVREKEVVVTSSVIVIMEGLESHSPLD